MKNLKNTHHPIPSFPLYVGQGYAVRARTLSCAGACEAVVTALRSHPYDLALQMHGVWAIEYLAWDQHHLTRGRLAAMGVREVVQQVMMRFPGDAMVCEHATEALPFSR